MYISVEDIHTCKIIRIDKDVRLPVQQLKLANRT